MEKNILVWIIVIILIVLTVIWNKNYKKTINIQNEVSTNTVETVKWKEISSTKLNSMLSDKDFKLIDVHIPEQAHIPKTDYVIPYNKIGNIISIVPNKDTKIILYCRSGSMSKNASEILVKKGYTNIYNLTNGMNEWKSENRKTIPIGSIVNKN